MFLNIIILACFLAVWQSLGVTGVNQTISKILSRIKLNDRIIGGDDAKPGQFPHQVSLQIEIVPKIPGLDFIHFCGGSIIDKEYILTAAHCIDGFEEAKRELEQKTMKVVFWVKAGKHNLHIEEDEQDVTVEKWYKHQKWNGRNQVGPYDIALIKMSFALDFNKRIAKIRLAKKNSEPTGTALLSGWGAISNDTKKPKMPMILQKVLTQIVPRDKCKKAIRDVAAEEGGYVNDVVHETNICTGPLTGGISACGGDSGGPLIQTRSDGQTELIGIVSWGMIPCGRKGAPSVFTRVSSFIDWIDTTQKLGLDSGSTVRTIVIVILVFFFIIMTGAFLVFLVFFILIRK